MPKPGGFKKDRRQYTDAAQERRARRIVDSAWSTDELEAQAVECGARSAKHNRDWFTGYTGAIVDDRTWRSWVATSLASHRILLKLDDPILDAPASNVL